MGKKTVFLNVLCSTHPSHYFTIFTVHTPQLHIHISIKHSHRQCFCFSWEKKAAVNREHINPLCSSGCDSAFSPPALNTLSARPAFTCAAEVRRPILAIHPCECRALTVSRPAERRPMSLGGSLRPGQAEAGWERRSSGAVSGWCCLPEATGPALRAPGSQG